MNTEVFFACAFAIIGHGVLLIYLFTMLDSKIDNLLAISKPSKPDAAASDNGD